MVNLSEQSQPTDKIMRHMISVFQKIIEINIAVWSSGIGSSDKDSVTQIRFCIISL